jgi:hypothetical protein
MHVVEIRVRQSELSKQMGAMRVWLDEQRIEPSNFACHDGDHGVVVCLEFRIGRHAEGFAKRFGGRRDGSLAADVDEETTVKVLETGLSPSGVVG